MRLIFLFWLICAGALASDEVAKVVRMDYYEVSGTSAGALLSAMKEHGPFTNSAYTDWHIDWNYEFTSKSNVWVLRSFDARVQIRYTFPKWVDSARSDEALRKEWKRYMDATALHERGHSDIGMAAAKEMIRLFKSRSWQAATRKDLKAQVDEECEKILKEFKAREVAYDKQTDHGRTQGARLKTPGS